MTLNPNLAVWLDREGPAAGERKALATPRDEFDGFKSCGLTELYFEDYVGNEVPPTRGSG
jgi:hypothetical protein